MSVFLPPPTRPLPMLKTEQCKSRKSLDRQEETNGKLAKNGIFELVGYQAPAVPNILTVPFSL
jgi:hypothetical protein